MINSGAQLLTKSAKYFINDPHARKFAEECKVIDWLQNFINYLEKANVEQVKLLTVAVVGEFKAGKSTLINALIGKEVAFVDAFEATTSVAFIRPGFNESVLVDNLYAERKSMSIPEFVEACRKYKLRDVSRVDMTVNHPLPFILIDTPGMGSITSEHEERAEAAIMDSADLVLWVMDPSDLLSAKEGAFLRRARSINLPILCILSKTDELTSEEVEQCIECIEQTTGVPKSDIIAVSAKNHIECGNDSGVSKLLNRLHLACQSSGEVQNQAMEAKLTEFLDEYEDALGMIHNYVKSQTDWLEDERNIFGQEAQIVKSILIGDAKYFLEDSIKTHFEEQLAKLINSGMPNEQLCRVILQEFCKDRLPSVSDKIAERVRQKAIDAWNKSFDDRYFDLKRQIENLARNQMQGSDSEAFLRGQLDLIEDRRLAITQGFGAVPAAIGAGALTLLFDPTGITANLVTMAIGALAGHALGESAKHGAQPASEKVINYNAVSDLAQQLSNAIVDRLLASEITGYIDCVVDVALEERCRQRIFGMSLKNVKSVQANLDQIMVDIGRIKLLGNSQNNLNTESLIDGESGLQDSGACAGFSNKARLQLVRIIKEYGTDICQSPKKVEALLKDYCGDCSKEVFLLTQCLCNGVTNRILSLRNKMPKQAIVCGVVNDFKNATGIEHNAASWAVESWSEALFSVS